MTIIRNDRYPETDNNRVAQALLDLKNAAAHLQPAVRAETADSATDDTFSSTVTFGGAWNGAHLIIGSAHVWQDATGALRQKNGVPASDLDGALL